MGDQQQQHIVMLKEHSMEFDSLKSQGKMKAALKHLEAVVQILLELHGSKSVEVDAATRKLVETLNQTAVVYMNHEYFPSARKMLGKALNLTEPNGQIRNEKDRSSLRATTFNNLGCLFQKTGNFEAAALNLEAAAKIQDGMGIQSDHPSAVHMNLSAVYSMLSRHDAALQQAEKAVRLAEGMAQLALEGAQDLEGQSMGVMAVACFNLACQLEKIGKRKEASLSYEKAVGFATRQWGINHSRTVEMRDAYSQFQEQQEDSSILSINISVISSSPPIEIPLKMPSKVLSTYSGAWLSSGPSASPKRPVSRLLRRQELSMSLDKIASPVKLQPIIQGSVGYSVASPPETQRSATSNRPKSAPLVKKLANNIPLLSPSMQPASEKEILNDVFQRLDSARNNIGAGAEAKKAIFTAKARNDFDRISSGNGTRIHPVMTAWKDHIQTQSAILSQQSKKEMHAAKMAQIAATRSEEYLTQFLQFQLLPKGEDLDHPAYAMVSHYMVDSDIFGDCTWAETTPKLRVIPSLLMQCGRADELQKVLCCLHFIVAKSLQYGLLAVLADLQDGISFLNDLPNATASKERLIQYYLFIQVHFEKLWTDPNQAFPLARALMDQQNYVRADAEMAGYCLVHLIEAAQSLMKQTLSDSKKVKNKSKNPVQIKDLVVVRSLIQKFRVASKRNVHLVLTETYQSTFGQVMKFLEDQEAELQAAICSAGLLLPVSFEMMANHCQESNSASTWWEMLEATCQPFLKRIRAIQTKKRGETTARLPGEWSDVTLLIAFTSSTAKAAELLVKFVIPAARRKAHASNLRVSLGWMEYSVGDPENERKMTSTSNILDSCTIGKEVFGIFLLDPEALDISKKPVHPVQMLIRRCSKIGMKECVFFVKNEGGEQHSEFWDQYKADDPRILYYRDENLYALSANVYSVIWDILSSYFACSADSILDFSITERHHQDRIFTVHLKNISDGCCAAEPAPEYEFIPRICEFMHSGGTLAIRCENGGGHSAIIASLIQSYKMVTFLREQLRESQLDKELVTVKAEEAAEILFGGNAQPVHLDLAVKLMVSHTWGFSAGTGVATSGAQSSNKKPQEARWRLRLREPFEIRVLHFFKQKWHSLDDVIFHICSELAGESSPLLRDAYSRGGLPEVIRIALQLLTETSGAIIFLDSLLPEEITFVSQHFKQKSIVCVVTYASNCGAPTIATNFAFNQSQNSVIELVRSKPSAKARISLAEHWFRLRNIETDSSKIALVSVKRNADLPVCIALLTGHLRKVGSSIDTIRSLRNDIRELIMLDVLPLLEARYGAKLVEAIMMLLFFDPLPWNFADLQAALIQCGISVNNCQLLFAAFTNLMDLLCPTKIASKGCLVLPSEIISEVVAERYCFTLAQKPFELFHTPPESLESFYLEDGSTFALDDDILKPGCLALLLPRKTALVTCLEVDNRICTIVFEKSPSLQCRLESVSVPLEGAIVHRMHHEKDRIPFLVVGKDLVSRDQGDLLWIFQLEGDKIFSKKMIGQGLAVARNDVIIDRAPCWPGDKVKLRDGRCGVVKLIDWEEFCRSGKLYHCNLEEADGTVEKRWCNPMEILEIEDCSQPIRVLDKELELYGKQWQAGDRAFIDSSLELGPVRIVKWDDHANGYLVCRQLQPYELKERSSHRMNFGCNVQAILEGYPNDTVATVSVLPKEHLPSVRATLGNKLGHNSFVFLKAGVVVTKEKEAKLTLIQCSVKMAPKNSRKFSHLTNLKPGPLFSRLQKSLNGCIGIILGPQGYLKCSSDLTNLSLLTAFNESLMREHMKRRREWLLWLKDHCGIFLSPQAEQRVREAAKGIISPHGPGGHLSLWDPPMISAEIELLEDNLSVAFDVSWEVMKSCAVNSKLEELDERSCNALHRAAVSAVHASSLKILASSATEKILSTASSKQNVDGNTPLHVAVHHQVASIVNILCSIYGANVNLRNNMGHTPLEAAAVIQTEKQYRRNATRAAIATSIEIFQFLCCLPSVDAILHRGILAQCLRDAAFYGDSKLIVQLMQVKTRKFLLTDMDCLGRTALHYAILNGHKDAAIKLLELGANPGEKDWRGQTPLHIATERGRWDCVIAILQIAPDLVCAQDANKRTIFHLWKYGDAENSNESRFALELAVKVSKLVASDIPIAADALGLFPQHLCAVSGTPDEMAPILQLSGGNLGIKTESREARTALIQSCIAGNCPMVEYLLSIGDDGRGRDARGCSPFILFVRNKPNDLKVLKPDALQQLQQCANEEERAESMSKCVSLEDRRLLQALVRSGIPPDIQTPSHCAAIVAVRNRKPEMLSFYLNRDPDASLKDYNGRALALACLLGDFNLVKVFTQIGVFVDYVGPILPTDTTGLEQQWGLDLALSPVARAASTNNLDLVKFLVDDCEADPCAGECNALTAALHCPTSDPSEALVRYLLVRCSIDPTLDDVATALAGSSPSVAQLLFDQFWSTGAQCSELANKKMVRRFRPTPDVNYLDEEQGFSCFLHACRLGLASVVRTLLPHCTTEQEEDTLLEDGEENRWIRVWTRDSRRYKANPIVTACLSYNGMPQPETIAVLVTAKNAPFPIPKMLPRRSVFRERDGDLLVQQQLVRGASGGILEHCQFGRARAVELLLAEGVDPNTKDEKEGKSCLYYAAQGGHLPVVNLLLNAGAAATYESAVDENTIGKRRIAAPLAGAASQGHNDVVMRLLEAGAEINELSRGLQMLKMLSGPPIVVDVSAAHLAASHGHWDTLSLLLDQGAQCSYAWDSPKLSASGTVMESILRSSKTAAGLWSDQREFASPKELDREALILIALQRCSKSESEGGQKKNRVAWVSAVTWACLRRMRNVAEQIAENVSPSTAGSVFSVDPRTGKGPLHFLCPTASPKVIAKLLEQKCDPCLKDGRGMTALHHASRTNENSTSLAALCRAGKKADAEYTSLMRDNCGGRTCLHHAAMFGNLEAIKVLLSKEGSVDINVADSNGLVAMDYAAKHGQLKVVQYIRGQEEARRRGDDTTLRFSIAAMRQSVLGGSFPCLSYLFSPFGEREKTIEDAEMAQMCIHDACMYGRTEQVRLLLEFRANPSGIDSFGISALECALALGHLETVIEIVKMVPDTLNLFWPTIVAPKALQTYTRIPDEWFKKLRDEEEEPQALFQTPDVASSPLSPAKPSTTEEGGMGEEEGEDEDEDDEGGENSKPPGNPLSALIQRVFLFSDDEAEALIQSAACLEYNDNPMQKRAAIEEALVEQREFLSKLMQNVWDVTKRREEEAEEEISSMKSPSAVNTPMKKITEAGGGGGGGDDPPVARQISMEDDSFGFGIGGDAAAVVEETTIEDYCEIVAELISFPETRRIESLCAMLLHATPLQAASEGNNYKIKAPVIQSQQAAAVFAATPDTSGAAVSPRPYSDDVSWLASTVLSTATGIPLEAVQEITACTLRVAKVSQAIPKLAAMFRELVANRRIVNWSVSVEEHYPVITATGLPYHDVMMTLNETFGGIASSVAVTLLSSHGGPCCGSPLFLTIGDSEHISAVPPGYRVVLPIGKVQLSHRCMDQRQSKPRILFWPVLTPLPVCGWFRWMMGMDDSKSREMISTVSDAEEEASAFVPSKEEEDRRSASNSFRLLQAASNAGDFLLVLMSFGVSLPLANPTELLEQRSVMGWRWSPVCVAGKYGDLGALKRVLRRGHASSCTQWAARLGKESVCPLLAALEGNAEDCAVHLLESGVDLSNGGERSTIDWIPSILKKGWWKLLEELAKWHLHRNISTGWPDENIDYLIAFGRMDVLTILLEQGVMFSSKFADVITEWISNAQTVDTARLNQESVLTCLGLPLGFLMRELDVVDEHRYGKWNPDTLVVHEIQQELFHFSTEVHWVLRETQGDAWEEQEGGWEEDFSNERSLEKKKNPSGFCCNVSRRILRKNKRISMPAHGMRWRTCSCCNLVVNRQFISMDRKPHKKQQKQQPKAPAKQKLLLLQAPAVPLRISRKKKQNRKVQGSLPSSGNYSGNESKEETKTGGVKLGLLGLPLLPRLLPKGWKPSFVTASSSFNAQLLPSTPTGAAATTEKTKFFT